MCMPLCHSVPQDKRAQHRSAHLATVLLREEEWHRTINAHDLKDGHLGVGITVWASLGGVATTVTVHGSGGDRMPSDPEARLLVAVHSPSRESVMPPLDAIRWSTSVGGCASPPTTTAPLLVLTVLGSVTSSSTASTAMRTEAVAAVAAVAVAAVAAAISDERKRRCTG